MERGAVFLQASNGSVAEWEGSLSVPTCCGGCLVRPCCRFWCCAFAIFVLCYVTVVAFVRWQPTMSCSQHRYIRDDAVHVMVERACRKDCRFIHANGKCRAFPTRCKRCTAKPSSCILVAKFCWICRCGQLMSIFFFTLLHRPVYWQHLAPAVLDGDRYAFAHVASLWVASLEHHPFTD